MECFFWGGVSEEWRLQPLLHTTTPPHSSPGRSGGDGEDVSWWGTFIEGRSGGGEWW